MYRESSRIAATAIAVAVWTINTTASAVAIVLLVAVLRSAGAEWVPGIGFWQGLNAPDGAGCFPTYDKDFKGKEKPNVSMHLMVLGASRPDSVSGDPGSRTVSMHLMVLGASRLLCWKELSSSYWWSQCT